MKLPAVLRGKVDKNVDNLVSTLAELGILLHITEQDRTPRTILWLLNTSFLHGILRLKVFFPPKQLSTGLMFDLYFHKISLFVLLRTQRLQTGKPTIVTMVVHHISLTSSINLSIVFLFVVK